MHDALQTGLPLALILIGIILNRHDVKDLRREMLENLERRFDEVDRRFDKVDRRFDEVYRRFDTVDAELRYFHDTTGKLSGRVDELSRRVQ